MIDDGLLTNLSNKLTHTKVLGSEGVFLVSAGHLLLLLASSSHLTVLKKYLLYDIRKLKKKNTYLPLSKTPMHITGVKFKSSTPTDFQVQATQLPGAHRRPRPRSISGRQLRSDE